MKGTSVVLLAFLVGSILASSLANTVSASEGITWTKYAGNPLNLGLENVWNPWVLYDGHTFKMWYTSLTGPDKVPNIYFADSINGIDWNVHGVVLDIADAGSWESTGVFRPVVLYDGAIYKMWYEGRDSGTPGIQRFGYATSPDGINWTKYGANPVLVPGGNGGWDDCNIAGKAILFNGTCYLMWYGGEAYIDSPFMVGVATSADGIVWTKYSGNPVLVPASSGWENHWLFPGAVLLNGGLYEMWYSGIGQPPPAYGIGLATSLDGFSWSKYTENPVLSTGPSGSWDSWSVGWACVIRKGNDLLMFYDGQAGGGSQDVGRIGLAFSFAPSIPTEVDFFLHGGACLDNSPPTAMTAKYKDSLSIKFSGGNPWKEIGIWAAPASLTDGRLEALNGLDVWLGLKNSDDQGTNFDLRAEVYKDGVLVASSETYLIKGVTRNPDKALKVTVSFGPFSPANFDGIDETLSLKILTRIGTDGNGHFGGGHSSAVGLRLYFDAVSRPAMLTTSIA